MDNDDVELAAVERRHSLGPRRPQLHLRPSDASQGSYQAYSYGSLDRDPDDTDSFEPVTLDSERTKPIWRVDSLSLPLTSSDETLRTKAKRTGQARNKRPFSMRSAFGDFIAKQSGWRLGVFTGLCLSALVLCGNLILLFVGLCYGGYRDGIGVLAQGRSDSISRLSTAYHILINLLSTLLLSASNYAMQVLCSPTRQDIDRAHSEGFHLSVGVLSPRNIGIMKGRRRLHWYILMITSVSLHLFYNSAISEVTIGHQYTAHFFATNEVQALYPGTDSLAMDDFIRIYDTKYIPDHGDVYFYYDALAFTLVIPIEVNKTLRLLNNLTQVPFANLTKPWVPVTVERLHEPAVPAVSLPSDVYVDTNYTRFPLSTDGLDFARTTYWASWLNTTNGTYDDVNPPPPYAPPIHIKNIQSVPLEDGSKVQIIMSYMLIVIACNLLKLIVMWQLWRSSADELLTTVGDAVASFLQRPDRSTIGLCLMDRRSLVDAFAGDHRRRSARAAIISHDHDEGRSATFRFQRGDLSPSGWFEMNDGPAPKLKHTPAISWQSQSPLEGAAVVWGSKETSSTFRWVKAILLVLVGPMLASVALIPSIAPGDSFAWGTASSHRLTIGTTSSAPSNVLLSTWIANAPQLVLSMLYIVVNNFLTRLCLAKEWNNFGVRSRTLRVTSPEGQQRSTHFLQLPYRYALPLTAVAGVLHWILSQSIFLMRLEMRDGAGALIPYDCILHAAGRPPAPPPWWHWSCPVWCLWRI